MSGVKQEIAATARKRGLNNIAIAGMMGNAAQESNFDPTVNEYGLWQTSGYGPTSQLSVAQQTDNAINLMGASVVDAMNRAKTPQEAARIMEGQWEHPEPAVANIPHRESAAAEAYNELSGGGGNIFSGAGFGKGGLFTKAGEAFQEVEGGVNEAGKTVTGGAKLAESVLKWVENPTRLLKLVSGAALLYMGVHALTSGTPAETVVGAPSKAVKAVAGVVPSNKAVKLASARKAARTHSKGK